MRIQRGCHSVNALTPRKALQLPRGPCLGSEASLSYPDSNLSSPISGGGVGEERDRRRCLIALWWEKPRISSPISSLWNDQGRNSKQKESFFLSSYEIIIRKKGQFKSLSFSLIVSQQFWRPLTTPTPKWRCLVKNAKPAGPPGHASGASFTACVALSDRSLSV